MISILAFIAWLTLGVVAFLSADRDAATWDNPLDHLCHPYRLRTKVLVMSWLVAILPLSGLLSAA